MAASDALPILVDGSARPVVLWAADQATSGTEPAPAAATLVVHGPPAAAMATARVLVEAGADAVVEVEVTRGRPVDRAAIEAIRAGGLAVGAALVPGPGSDSDPDSEDEAAAGWEIGAVTVLLGLGVRTVRGVDARRLAHLRAVDLAWPVPGPVAAASNGTPS